MIRIRTIRPLLAGFLLLLFAFGVTPKVALHALVANHTDTHLRGGSAKDPQYNKAGFHCATENLVVDQTFLNHSISIQVGLLPSCLSHPATALSSLFAFYHPLFRLRGPPAEALL